MIKYAGAQIGKTVSAGAAGSRHVDAEELLIRCGLIRTTAAPDLREVAQPDQPLGIEQQRLTVLAQHARLVPER